MPTVKIDDLLDEGHQRFVRYTPLHRLLKASANQKQWTAQLRALLDPPLRYEVEVTEVRGSIATLLCSSSAAATKLRFLMPDLLPRLQTLANFNAVTECNIRIAP